LAALPWTAPDAFVRILSSSRRNERIKQENAWNARFATVLGDNKEFIPLPE
jgi:hypothetical protein